MPHISKQSVRVAIDAMGGDYAPREIVKGAIEAARKDRIDIILVGSKNAIQREMSLYDVSHLSIQVVNASEVIQDGESPVASLHQKPDASIPVAMNLVKDGKADAMVSMGSTGTVMVSALETLGKLPGIKRPTVGKRLRGIADNTVMFDLGANVDCKPRDLLTFAIVGSVLARKMLRISNPTVALLSNGAEEGKGNKLVKESHQLFKKSNLNFIGNVEGHDIPAGKANVIICDGFTGNILTKFCEALGDSIIERLKRALDKHLPKEKLDAITNDLFAMTHIADICGGGLVYGVNGVVWIGHGRSKAPQLATAIHQVKLAVETNLVEELTAELAQIKSEDQDSSDTQAMERHQEQ